jgi:hypothetical protein
MHSILPFQQNPEHQVLQPYMVQQNPINVMATTLGYKAYLGPVLNLF